LMKSKLAAYALRDDGILMLSTDVGDASPGHHCQRRVSILSIHL
jgi:hypothetical protein